MFVANDGVHGAEPWSATGTSSPDRIVSAGNTLFFGAFTVEHGRELWVSDGTLAGTRIGPGRVAFSAFTPALGSELWESDGTVAGTRLVADIMPGPDSSGPLNLSLQDGAVYFSAANEPHGREPWIYALSRCACDWDSSGRVDSQDFFGFQIGFFAGDADFDGTGETNSNDFFAFLACFFAACE